LKYPPLDAACGLDSIPKSKLACAPSAAIAIQAQYTPKNEKGLHRCNPLISWLLDLDSNQGPAD
jgi:hypothetical protein